MCECLWMSCPGCERWVASYLGAHGTPSIFKVSNDKEKFFHYTEYLAVRSNADKYCIGSAIQERWLKRSLDYHYWKVMPFVRSGIKTLHFSYTLGTDIVIELLTKTSIIYLYISIAERFWLVMWACLVFKVNTDKSVDIYR